MGVYSERYPHLYQRGYYAHQNGATRSSNPFSHVVQGPQHAAWDEGWSVSAQQNEHKTNTFLTLEDPN